ncbi:MAG: cytochrome C peroxidase [Deltaproteobacteria bacterium]|nr:MAG: cytochrome C peroxidase [Deltaproteobacteria bacterium]
MHTVVRFRPARLPRTARPLVAVGQRMNSTASRTAMMLACLMIATGSPPAWAGLKSLKRVPIPLPPNLGDFVADRSAAIELGKALFWETQAGGDGVQACAQCHFQAGADVRVTNTLNPGANGVFDTAPAGATLNAGNFPINNGDVVGSQGIMKSLFVGLSGGPVDSCTPLADAVFPGLRQVTGRNTPLNLNAIFNFRSFWDGRANNVFNGVNPAGPTDPNARVLKVINGVPTPVAISLKNASLASQAVGPPNNRVEMSCDGRNFPQLGRKLLGLPPLGQQMVDPADSALGGLSNFPGPGLNTSYAALIQAAFRPEWWNSSAIVNGFSVMENNFSLYWGLSVMLYNSTQVSDDTRFDRFMDGNLLALNLQEQQGLDVFRGKGRCTACHDGGPLTRATVDSVDSTIPSDAKRGFINTGVRPVADDGGDILQPGQAKFKTPGLRNLELTGPYFHNGDKATLRQVVDFYDRGGDFPNQFTDSQIRPLGLAAAEKDALVAFLLALTDDRVRFQRAPFDHPSLNVPNGPNIPAIGAGGAGTPLGTFLGLSPFQP